ncbi:DNA glycosylase, partial [Xylogone sp. PMI_703]
KRLPLKSPYFTPPASASKKKFKDVVVSKPKALPETRETRDEGGGTSPESPPKSSGVNKQKLGLVSCIPFPPLSSPFFGLIQERLANDPFRLLIAVTFLNRTHGKYAIPVFFELIEKYPTPESLACADKEDIVEIIRNLGLQRKRADKYQTYANIWLENPPTKGRRYAVRDYPMKGDGRNIDKDEILPDEDERVAWELGHITQGRYAIDSWRIFCRDTLRGEATSWNGEGSTKENFQPEWMRVLPEDKELRAYLRWMWLKEGFEWDPLTGEKEVASKELMQAAIEGNIAWDDQGGMRIIGPE